MSEDEANRILQDVGGMVSAAIAEIQFRSGNAATEVASGFPNTRVQVSAEPQSVEDGLTRKPPLEILWYGEGAPTGSRAYFLPFDPATILGEGGSDRCYDAPPPSLLIPDGESRFIYLKQDFTVTTAEACGDGGGAYGPYLATVTPGQAWIVMLEDIPVSIFPEHSPSGQDPCGNPETPSGGGFQYAGEYTLYFILLWLEGVAGSAPTFLNFWGHPSHPGTDLTNNLKARSMIIANLNGAGFPRWMYYGGGWVNIPYSPGDTSGTAAFAVVTVAP